jgi:hypothetical protein
MTTGAAAATTVRAQEVRVWGRGHLLDDLLVSALHGTVAAVEGDGVAVLVGQHLHLQVVGTRHQSHHEH